MARRVGWIALIAFGLRALVPIGFEPASHTVALVLCHKGFPVGFFSHRSAHHASHAPHAAGHRCAFCNCTSPAPAYTLAGLTHHVPYAIGLAPVVVPVRRAIRLAHTPQARAPPSPV